MIICGNSLDILPMFPPGYFHGCITSSPYWGLRDYGKGVECVFGGDEKCEHEWGPERIVKRGHPGDKSTLVGTQTAELSKSASGQGRFCQKCDAWSGQFGLEPTPEMYIEHTLEFLRAIWRVLRDDGVLWWNLADSYAGSGYHSANHKTPGISQAGRRNQAMPPTCPAGLKPKDLVGIPFRFFLAAQAAGWWMRNVIIWDKPNPMPESVDDRCTTSHEYLFLMAKSGTTQYWTHRDENGVRQKPKADYRWVNQLTGTEIDYAPDDWKEIVKCPNCNGGIITHTRMGVFWDEDCEHCGGEGEFQLWKRINLWQGHDYFYDADAIREGVSGTAHSRHAKGKDPSLEFKMQPAGSGNRNNPSFQSYMRDLPPEHGRNKRTVWTIPTQPFPDAHFATFPEELVEDPILTTPTKCCSECGAGHERVTEQATHFEGGSGAAGRSAEEVNVAGKWAGIQYGKNIKLGPVVTVETLGFRPTCSCNVDTVPARVLDLFAGRGTVGKMCTKHGRDYVLIEMAQDYLPMMLRYLQKTDIEYQVSEERWLQPRLLT